MSRISWEVRVNRPEFEDVAITKSSMNTDVSEATNSVYNSVVDSFDLSSDARRGLLDRIEGLHATFIDSDEEGGRATQFALGKLSLENVTVLRPAMYSELSFETLPQEIFLTSGSFSQEIENLHEAASEYSAETADEIATACEEQIAEFSIDHSLIVSLAIKLAISRRLVKYGVLPKELLNPDQAKKVGFDTWFGEIIAKNSGYEELSGSAKKRAVDVARRKYEENDQAARNLQNSIWAKVFHGLLPFQPEHNQMFFVYYMNKLVNNSEQSILFSDLVTVKLPQEEVERTLEQVYAPKNSHLKPF